MFSTMEIERTFVYIVDYVKDYCVNEELKKCLLEILSDYKDRMCLCIPSREHHSYPGGLVIHTYGVLLLSVGLCEGFEDKGLDMSLVVASAVLHDIGKCVGGSYRFNEDLLGHQYQSMVAVVPYLEKYNISEGYKKQILHCIKQHMLPDSEKSSGLNMLEAYIVRQSDDINAKLNSITNTSAIENGTVIDSGLFEHSIYKSYFK